MKIIVIILSLVLGGCGVIYRATHKTSNLNRLSVGMTKDEVIKKMGKPNSVRAKAKIEYLMYCLAPGAMIPCQTYFVRLIDGKVDAFGEKGDFDSENVPEIKATLDMNVKTNHKESPKK